MEQTDNCTCKKYNKTTDEIVKACSKHRQAAMALKEIGEKQKKKIDVYKQEIEHMKLEASDGLKQNDDLQKRNYELEKELVSLENKLKDKVNICNKNEDEFKAENAFLNQRLEKMCRMNEKQ